MYENIITKPIPAKLFIEAKTKICDPCFRLKVLPTRFRDTHCIGMYIRLAQFKLGLKHIINVLLFVHNIVYQSNQYNNT